MSDYRPLFGTGLSRSGGGLYTGLLSVHPQVELGLCPYLELYRSLRNAVLTGANGTAPTYGPMQDWYFTPDRIRDMDAILGGSLDLPFTEPDPAEFIERAGVRAALESKDIADNIAGIVADTYAGAVRNALEVVRTTRQSDATWIGYHEPWTIDFYPMLARAFPDAKFLVMLRDPRAIVNSIKGIARTHPNQVVQTLSYARHWRKYVALARRFQADPIFDGRLHVTSHDLIVTQPETAVRQICEFLGVNFKPEMLDTDNYTAVGGRQWQGNSSFEDVTRGISPHRATRWRNMLSTDLHKIINVLCGAEMALMGYEDPDVISAATFDDDVTTGLLRENSEFTNWRSDLEDPLQDIGFEMLRHRLLRSDQVENVDEDLIRRCYLFESTFNDLRSGQSDLLKLRAHLS